MAAQEQNTNAEAERPCKKQKVEDGDGEPEIFFAVHNSFNNAQCVVPISRASESLARIIKNYQGHAGHDACHFVLVEEEDPDVCEWKLSDDFVDTARDLDDWDFSKNWDRDQDVRFLNSCKDMVSELKNILSDREKHASTSERGYAPRIAIAFLLALPEEDKE